jgi:alcohol dehydrogenase/L-iditol 2-dehydrogenase
LLEVANVGVCGSDLHQWTADHSWPVNYPVVLGHEFGGFIAEIGKNVSKWKEGDRVVSETAAIIDMNSPMTKVGLYNLDPSRKGFGYGVNGAMTRYVRVPERCLHGVPDQISFEHACLTEPCCVAYSAVVENARLKPGDRVVVLGPGTIGILCAAMARLCGAEVAIVGLESDKHRLEIAKQYGCRWNERKQKWFMVNSSDPEVKNHFTYYEETVKIDGASLVDSLATLTNLATRSYSRP